MTHQKILLFYCTFNYINFFELTINQFMAFSVRLIPPVVAHCVFFNLQPSHLRVLPRNLENRDKIDIFSD